MRFWAKAASFFGLNGSKNLKPTKEHKLTPSCVFYPASTEIKPYDDIEQCILAKPVGDVSNINEAINLLNDNVNRIPLSETDYSIGFTALKDTFDASNDLEQKNRIRQLTRIRLLLFSEQPNNLLSQYDQLLVNALQSESLNDGLLFGANSFCINKVQNVTLRIAAEILIDNLQECPPECPPKPVNPELTESGRHTLVTIFLIVRDSLLADCPLPFEGLKQKIAAGNFFNSLSRANIASMQIALGVDPTTFMQFLSELYEIAERFPNLRDAISGAAMQVMSYDQKFVNETGSIKTKMIINKMRSDMLIDYLNDSTAGFKVIDGPNINTEDQIKKYYQRIILNNNFVDLIDSLRKGRHQ
jgi:hypothetical protein